MTLTRAEKDVELWKTWNSNKNKENLSPLFKAVEPIITKEVSRWASGPVARPVLNIEAKKLALNAFNNYDPSASQLSTHLTNQLKGISRIVYTHSNVARLPEHQTLKVGTYLTAKNELEEDLGREPTMQELSQHLRWSPQETERFSLELRSGLSTSKPVPPGFETYDSDKAFVDYIYNDLADQDKIVFEHTTGFNGNRVLSAKDLIKKTGMTQGQISHSKRRIAKLVLDARGIRDVRQPDYE
jgi:DNA-directed RNA polymerase specialized sigma subunit